MSHPIDACPSGIVSVARAGRRRGEPAGPRVDVFRHLIVADADHAFAGGIRLGLANQFERLLLRSGRIVELAVGVEPFELATRPDSLTVRPSRRAAGCRHRDPGAGGRDCRNRAALDRDVYAAGAAREPRVGDYRHNCLYLPSCIRSEGHGRMWQKHRTYPFAPRLLGRLHQSPSPYPLIVWRHLRRHV